MMKIAEAAWMKMPFLSFITRWLLSDISFRDWVDFQSTKLQQAELIQNGKEAAEVCYFM